MTFKKEWWVAVNTQAPKSMRPKIIYAMVEKLLFGESKEDDNVNYMPFLSLVVEDNPKDVAIDLTQDKTRLEAICMQNSITYADCLNYIKEFNDFNYSRDITHKNYAEAINHFSNWLRQQIKREQIDYKAINDLLLKDAKDDYKHFLSWVRSMAKYCYDNMTMPTKAEIQELKDMGISGNIATDIIRKIELNKAFRARRRNLFIAIKEVWNCKT